jgi:SAM-dependent methyltransferase
MRFMQTIANSLQDQAWNGPVGQHWADHADSYDGLVRGFNAALFAAAAIGVEDDVLDIGCGNGATTLLAARQAGWGQCVGVDLSAPMLRQARATAAASGVTNARFVQGDAQVYPFAEAAFDVAISRGGVMFFADHTAAFANIRRALRPGGRLAFISPPPPTADSAHARLYGLLDSLPRRSSSGDDAGRAMMSLADADRIRAVLEAAGFSSPVVELVEGPVCWGRDLDEAVSFFWASATLRLHVALAERTVSRLRAALRSELSGYVTADGVCVPGSVWLVTARSR